MNGILSRKFLFVLVLATALGTLIWFASQLWKSRNKEEIVRVLITEADFQKESEGLHRLEMPIDRERALLQNFAAENHLKIEYVPVPSFQQLFLYLKENRGDLISASLSETADRKKSYLLSIPFDYTREILFTSTQGCTGKRAEELLNSRVGQLLPGTSYVENFIPFAAVRPKLRYRILPHTITHDELIESVNRRQIGFSILNECDLDAWLAYRSGISKLCVIRDRVPLVFAARKNSRALMEKLNSYIRSLEIPEPKPAAAVSIPEPAPVPTTLPSSKVTSSPVSRPQPEISQPAKKFSRRFVLDTPDIPRQIRRHDLDRIRKRGVIRMLTTNDVFTCYLKQGELYGFEYELAKRFADSLHLKLVTVIPKDFDELTRYLAEGKGDFVAANFSCTPDRIKKFSHLSFSVPYYEVNQLLVGRSSEKIRTISDLTGRKIFVRKGNSYYATLLGLQKQGAKFKIIPLPEEQNAIETLYAVDAGKYDLTVVDDIYYQLACNSGCKLKKLLVLKEHEKFSWLVRKNNPQLAAAINQFFRKEHKSAFYNLCVKRHFGSKKQHQSAPLVVKKNANVISPYDPLFRKYAKRYQFRWTLLAAQSFQESRFQPDRINEIGATGLMQVMPATAKELGISNLTRPENGIHAGAKYLYHQRQRFSKELPPLERVCFALASYNAGYGHVLDARKLASRLGLNPNIWFKNTEKALALLETRRYASKAKFGYCRASETIPYVQNIILQTYHYQKLLEAQQGKRLPFQQKKLNLSTRKR